MVAIASVRPKFRQIHATRSEKEEMRATWKRDGVFSMQIAEECWTLGQMLRSPYSRFFDVFRQTDHWGGIDLNREKALFCVAVGRVVLQRLGHRVVTSNEATPSRIPFERYFIKPHVNYNGPPLFLGGNLVDLGQDGELDSPTAPIAVRDLNLIDHRDVICKHELTNMWGDKDIAARLLRCYQTGSDRNMLKEEVFPGVTCPRP